jgi:hypothetical protein
LGGKSKYQNNAILSVMNVYSATTLTLLQPLGIVLSTMWPAPDGELQFMLQRFNASTRRVVDSAADENCRTRVGPRKVLCAFDQTHSTIHAGQADRFPEF